MDSLFSPIDHNLETNLTYRIATATKRVSSKAQWNVFLLTLVGVDILTTTAAFRLAYALRFEFPLPFFGIHPISQIAFYQYLAFTYLIPSWIALFWAVGLYKRQNLLGGVQEYSLIFRASTVGLLLVIVVGFVDRDLVFAHGWIIIAWGLTFLFPAVCRFWLRRAVYVLRRRGFFLSSTLIVGGNQEGVWLADQLRAWKTSGLHVVGFVDEKVQPGTVIHGGLQALGGVDQLDELIERFQIEELILATSAISSRNKMLEIFQRYGIDGRVNVRLSSGLYEIITTGLTIKEFAYVPLVGVNKVRLTGVDEMLKLALDYAITLPGLVAILPVLGLIALLIKLDSPGPVVYRRRVMGMNGRQFDAFKFRTMRVDGDRILEAHPQLKAELALTHKLKQDPRVTRIGKVLRKYSLDELPQLFNVVRRDMSLVGPRMISPAEMGNYGRWGLNLLTVRPGITGQWQISGRSDVSYEERVRLDMYYIRNWNIWLDLQLLVQTPLVVITGRGAY